MADSVWSCKKEFGSACKGLPADNEHEGKEYCVLHFPSVDKNLAGFKEAIEKKLKDKDFDFRGVYFPGVKAFLATFEEEADFSEATFEGEANFFGATFKQRAHFNSTMFKQKAHFNSTMFKQKAHFNSATFEGVADFTLATFKETAYFVRVTFEEMASFQYATFEERADFQYATFGQSAEFLERPTVRGKAVTFKEQAWFLNTTFEGKAEFSGITFEEQAGFSEATFERAAYFSHVSFQQKAQFAQATFREEGIFWSLETFPRIHFSFGRAVIEKPERFSFHSTYLRPSWFIDVDAQKFDFSDVEWFRLPDGDELKLEKEIGALESVYSEVPPSRLRKLQKACRKLMNNAEENSDYATANEFHYWSMELARKEAMVLAREKRFREGLRRFGLIDALYGALSGYGERPRRAFLVLVGMGTLFAILYVTVAGSMEHVGQAFLYSLAAMVRLTGVPAMAPLTKLLQPSEPGLFQLLVTAEGILGPSQIALLALAVRRKVMR